MEEVRVEEIHELISQLLNEKKYKALKEELMKMYPVDIAETFEQLSAEEYMLLFRLLQKDLAAEVFSYLTPQHRKEIVADIHESQLKYILDELYFDDKIDFLEEMPANFVKTLITSAPPAERRLINQFLNYPEASAGSLMTIEYVDLKKDMTVGEALAHIRRVGMDKETIYTCYVLDDTRKLLGILSLRHLVLSDSDTPISDIMFRDIVLVGTLADQEEVAELFKRYDLMAIPVVDAEHRLIGIITIDDIVDVIEQENTEDFQKMAAMQPSDDDYLEANVFSLSKRRIPWLMILMISATFTGGIISYYEGLLSTAAVLMAFVPMLMDSGGNAGSQSSTLIIRGLALGEVTLKDWAKVFFKELRVGFVVALSLALVNALRMLITGNAMPVVFIVNITLVFTIVTAKLIGGLLPLVAKSLKLDPAIMAGPLITTIVDALSLIIYFAIASVFF